MTLGEEVDYFWAPEWTLATWIFVSSRYATLIGMALQLLPAPNYTVRFFYTAVPSQTFNVINRGGFIGPLDARELSSHVP